VTQPSCFNRATQQAAVGRRWLLLLLLLLLLGKQAGTNYAQQLVHVQQLQLWQLQYLQLLGSGFMQLQCCQPAEA
jgi:hypothetical protein